MYADLVKPFVGAFVIGSFSFEFGIIFCELGSRTIFEYMEVRENQLVE